MGAYNFNMSRYNLLLFISLIMAVSGCKKKENNIIQQAYGEPLRTYKRSKEKIKNIQDEHLKKLKSIEDSLK